MNDQIIIDDRLIGVNHSPYIVAELSANHLGCIENAFKIIEEAKKAGADAVKLQTYRPDTITLDSNNDEFQIHGGPWDGKNLYQLYEEAHMPWDWHEPLFEHAKKNKITIFSSPFDSTAVDFLESINCPAYKIASPEVIDIPLIEKVASTLKPVIISTGMANMSEIEEAISALKDNGCSEYAILHCISAYPTPFEKSNLKAIQTLQNHFDCPVGLSDHTEGISAAIAATAIGAKLIEKHFKLDMENEGVDSLFSIDPEEFQVLVKEARSTFKALGDGTVDTSEIEQGTVKFRRSLYAIKDIKKGEEFTSSNVASIRPGFGLHPRYLNQIIGEKAKKDIGRGCPIELSMIG